MIICNDTDLFGGRISIVSTDGFCCQIETTGEFLSPSTIFHDLLGLGADHSSKPVASLFHELPGGCEDLLRRHRLLVEFVNAVTRMDDRLALATAIRLANWEFSHFGDWKWPETPASTAVFDESIGTQLHGWPADFDLAARLALPVVHPAIPPGRHYERHADSPLAD